MLNGIFLLLVVGSVVTAAFTGKMEAVGTGAIKGAKTAVDLALVLLGQMALWLGFMRILKDGGLLPSLARAVAPVMTRLFPGVPAAHPAMSAMIMNLSANVLGLGNAATPFGLKAMRELDRLNDRPGVATNAMALFLAINTSGLAVIPIQAMAARVEQGSTRIGDIILPTMLATALAALTGILVAKLLEGRRFFAPERYGPKATEPKGDGGAIKGLEEAEALAAADVPWSKRRALAALVVVGAIGYALVLQLSWQSREQALSLVVRGVFATWMLPVLIVAVLLFGFARRVSVYESFIQGAKEGFDIAVMVIPFLVAMLAAISMFRASGAMEALAQAVAVVVDPIGFPAELLPMALMRPLSGSGSLAVLIDLMKTHGPDSFVGLAASTMYGSTETTFYVLAVYFGSIGVRATRHTLLPCLAADLAGLVGAVYIAHWFFG